MLGGVRSIFGFDTWLDLAARMPWGKLTTIFRNLGSIVDGGEDKEMVRLTSLEFWSLTVSHLLLLIYHALPWQR